MSAQLIVETTPFFWIEAQRTLLLEFLAIATVVASEIAKGRTKPSRKSTCSPIKLTRPGALEISSGAVPKISWNLVAS